MQINRFDLANLCRRFVLVTYISWGVSEEVSVSADEFAKCAARVLGAGPFLFKFVFKSVPKLIWRARVRSKLNFGAVARVLGAGNFLCEVVFKRYSSILSSKLYRN